MSLTPAHILLNWEQDWDKNYFTFTEEGDAIIYDMELDQFYFENYRQEISYHEACLLLDITA